MIAKLELYFWPNHCGGFTNQKMLFFYPFVDYRNLNYKNLIYNVQFNILYIIDNPNLNVRAN